MSASAVAWLRREAGRILRFGIVGLGATATHVGVLFALVELAGLHPELANPVAFVAALPVSYLGHYHWTYRAAGAHGETALRFVAVSGSSFAVSQATLAAVAALDGPYQLAVAIFVVLVPATNFVLFHLLVFGRRSGGK